MIGARPFVHEDVERMSEVSATVDGLAPARLPARSDTRDDARLRAMFSAHFDFIWRSLRRLGVPEASVDDALQQVFLVASRRMSDIRGDAERSFLFSTALRVAADARKSAKVRHEIAHDVLPEVAAPSQEGPEERLEQGRARAMLDALLEELPLDLRAVFVLFELEEMATPEIAALLGIPPGTAASRLRRARETFQEAAKRMQAQARFRGGVR
jgi:RNA polymerase sigma-70 factor (ECF subfamily)